MPGGTRELKAVRPILAETARLDLLAASGAEMASVSSTVVVGDMAEASARDLVDEAILWGRGRHAVASQVADRVLVALSAEAGRTVPGRLVAAADADLCFDADGLVERGRSLAASLAREGVDRHRLLIGIPATWEGIRAMRVLAEDGVDCAADLVVSLAQVAAALEAGARLVVLRLDGRDGPGEADTLLAEVVPYWRLHGGPSILAVGGAGGRAAELPRDVLLACGADALGRRVDGPERATAATTEAEPGAPARLDLDEKTFRFMLNQDGTAEESLSRALRRAIADLRRLRRLVSDGLESRTDPLAAPFSEPLS